MKRLPVILILCFTVASGLRAQRSALPDTTVSLHYDRLSLKQVLTDLTDRYNLSLSYSDSQLPVADTITYHCTDQPFGEALQSLLSTNGISYDIVDGQIVLVPAASSAGWIQGSVVDAQTGKPIPFANIAIAGTARGTSSNELGEFLLQPGNLPAKLQVSHIAYQSQTLFVYNLAENVALRLQPAETTLPGVTVIAGKNKNRHYQLVRKAYDVLQQNSYNYKYGKAFYRQKSSRNDKYTEIFELFYDVKYTDDHIADWAVQEGRYAFQQGQDADVFLYNKNFTLLSRLFPLSQPNTDSYVIPLNKNVKRLFDISLKEVVKNNDRYLGVFSYVPKSTVGLPAPSGEFFMDLNNYQVLQMSATITDPTLDIVGFGDRLSSWKNYLLHYEISFVDDGEGKLLMDHIHMEHQFDYYYDKAFVGTVKTSSMLTFYEHYVPAKNKKLGGPIDFHTSDMEVIDHMGYNPDFWSQNPIVKRTPLEEKLIRDFEKNEAFGAVFLNTDDMVMLLPDAKNNKATRDVLARYQLDHPEADRQQLFVHLDNDQYQPGQPVRLAAYLLDEATKKTSVKGSVLSLSLLAADSTEIISKRMDINEGLAYGEMLLPQQLNAGKYFLRASANTVPPTYFQQNVNIGITNDTGFSVVKATDPRNVEIHFYPESTLLAGSTDTKMVFAAKSISGVPVAATWQIRDAHDSVWVGTKSNSSGIGSFTSSWPAGQPMYLAAIDDTVHHWPLPEPEKHGFSMKILRQNDQSMRVEVSQLPGLPSSLYLISTAHGKVYSVYEKQIHGNRGIIDLPIQHLPKGINTLLLTDRTARILARRSFYLPPQNPEIALTNAVWINKKAHKATFTFRITDQYGRPVKAHLSLGVTTDQLPKLRQANMLYLDQFSQTSTMTQLPEDMDAQELLDNLLIIGDDQSPVAEPVVARSMTGLYQDTLPMVAEITIPAVGNKTAQASESIRKHSSPSHDTWWLPRLDIDLNGEATVTLKMDAPGSKLYFSIQGVTNSGRICSNVIDMATDEIKAVKRKRDRK